MCCPQYLLQWALTYTHNKIKLKSNGSRYVTKAITIGLTRFIVQPAVLSEWLLFLFIIFVCCFCSCRPKKKLERARWKMEYGQYLLNSRGSHDPSRVRGFTATAVTAVLATLDRYVIRHSARTLVISIQQSAADGPTTVDRQL